MKGMYGVSRWRILFPLLKISAFLAAGALLETRFISSSILTASCLMGLFHVLCSSVFSAHVSGFSMDVVSICVKLPLPTG